MVPSFSMVSERRCASVRVWSRSRSCSKRPSERGAARAPRRYRLRAAEPSGAGDVRELHVVDVPPGHDLEAVDLADAEAKTDLERRALMHRDVVRLPLPRAVGHAGEAARRP